MAEALSDAGEAQALSHMSISESSVRIVLLGKSRSGKSASGNTILGREQFISKRNYKKGNSVKECKMGTENFPGRQVCVMDTPDLLDQHLSEDKVDCEKEKIVSLSYTGIHAFLLVVRVGKDLTKEQEVLETLVQLFGPDARRYTMVLFTKGDKLDTGETIENYIEEQGGELQQLLQDCGDRHHVFNNKIKEKTSQVSDLLDKIQAMVIKNGGKPYIRIKRTKSKQEGIDFSGGDAEDPGKLRLVLLGKTGSGKSACANTILGKEKFKSDISAASQTVRCERKDGVRNGKSIAVVDTPGLFDTKLSNTEVIGEICKCIGLASPGPHAFLLVVQIDRFTQEERSAIEKIKEAFGNEVAKYTMVLFTHKEKLGDKTIEQFIQTGNTDLQKLIDECGSRYHCFANKSENYTQVTSLLDKVQAMVTVNGGTCYSNETFQEVGKEIEAIQKEINEVKLQKLKDQKKSASKTEWEKIYSQLLEESRNEAVEILFSDKVVLALAKLYRKVRVTEEEREAALNAAEEQGIIRCEALKLALKASCKLARSKMCLTQ